MPAWFLRLPYPELRYIIIIVPMTSTADVTNNVRNDDDGRRHQIGDKVDKQQLQRHVLLSWAGLLPISLRLLPISLQFLLISLGLLLITLGVHSFL